MNKNINFYIYITLYPLCFLISFLFYCLNKRIDNLIIGFIICFVFTLVYSIKVTGFFSLYSIYLYTSAFFLYNCFPLTLFFDENFLIQNFPKRYSFPEDIGIIFILCCYISVYFVHLGYFFKKKKKLISQSSKIYYNKELYEKFGMILMVLFFFPLMYKTSIQIKCVMNYGYAAIYTGLLGKLKYPFWTTGSFIFFNSGYYIFLASRPSKKRYLFFTFFFILVYVFDSMKGARGNVLAIIIAVMYYYTKFYKTKIHFRKLVFLMIFIMGFTIVLGNIRKNYGSENVEQSTQSDISILIETALWSQTTTRAVPMLVIRGDLKYHNYPFFFFPIVNIFQPFIYKSSATSEFGLQHFNNPSLVTISNISKSAGKNGFGYDSAFLAEAYEFGGYFGIFIFSILLGVLLSIFDYSNMNVKNEFIPIIFSVLLSIPRMPRKSILDFLDNFWLLIFIYLLLLIINVFFNRKERNYGLSNNTNI